MLLVISDKGYRRNVSL